jgi:hypothetical protein
MSVTKSVASAKNLPSGARVFIFGSACYREDPNDIDMLFLYDSSTLPPHAAYSAFQPLLKLINKAINKSIHSIVLSIEEAEASHFIKNVEPIELIPLTTESPISD